MIKFWRVIDPKLRDCAFCEHGYGRQDAIYHARAWHQRVNGKLI